MQTSPRRLALAATLALAAALPATASATVPQADVDTAVQRGGAWIAGMQGKQSTGLAGGPTNGSLPGFNGNWAVTTLAAAGINAADVRNTAAGVTQSLQDYVDSTFQSGGSYAGWSTLPAPAAASAGALGRESLIASSAGLQITKLRQDLSLTATLASTWRVAQGDFGGHLCGPDGDLRQTGGVADWVRLCHLCAHLCGCGRFGRLADGNRPVGESDPPDI